MEKAEKNTKKTEEKSELKERAHHTFSLKDQFSSMDKNFIEFYRERGKGRYTNFEFIMGKVIDDPNEESEYLKSIKQHRWIENKIENENKIEQISKEIKELVNLIENRDFEIKKLIEDNTQLKEIIYNNTASYGLSEKVQIIPVDIYIDTEEPEDIFRVYESVELFLDAIGFEKCLEFRAEKGSWFKRLMAKSKDAITSDQVTDRLKEAEYALEVQVLKQQSEVDKNQSEALSNILKSVENVQNAAIRIGSLLVLKLTNKEGEVNVQVRSLSIKELHVLNKKPELLRNPKKILNALTKEVSDTTSLTESSEN